MLGFWRVKKSWSFENKTYLIYSRYVDQTKKLSIFSKLTGTNQEYLRLDWGLVKNKSPKFTKTSFFHRFDYSNIMENKSWVISP